MTATVLIAFLAVLALAYVAAPLRRPRTSTTSTERIDELEERKHTALVAILDLEAERDVGKLTEEDLAHLRTTYEAEALTALAELDAGDETQDALEREIAAARRRLQQRPR